MRLLSITVLLTATTLGPVRAQPDLRGAACSDWREDAELLDFAHSVGVYLAGRGTRCQRVEVAGGRGLHASIAIEGPGVAPGRNTEVTRLSFPTQEAADALLAWVNRDESTLLTSERVVELRGREAVLVSACSGPGRALRAGWAARPGEPGGQRRVMLLTHPCGRARIERAEAEVSWRSAPDEPAETAAYKSGEFYRFTWRQGRLRLEANGLGVEEVRDAVGSLARLLDPCTAARVQEALREARWEPCPPGKLVCVAGWRPSLTGTWEGSRGRDSRPVRAALARVRSEDAADVYEVRLEDEAGECERLIGRFDGLQLALQPEERGEVAKPVRGFTDALSSGLAGGGGRPERFSLTGRPVGTGFVLSHDPQAKDAPALVGLETKLRRVSREWPFPLPGVIPTSKTRVFRWEDFVEDGEPAPPTEEEQALADGW